ncbi:hypothetical protein [Kitasatospora sp. NBC_00315]|uniref:hypothetical protein n=1 Tax=Kitasatospora sp. NBC_00315 TaxID=2975963 RepID=UPI0032462752
MPFTPPDAPLTGDPPTGYIGLVTIEIKGLAPAATFRRLDLALDALAHALLTVPLSAQDRAAFEEFLSPDGRREIARQLIRTGEVRTLAFLGLDGHTVRIRAANPPRPGAVEAYRLPRPAPWDGQAPPYRLAPGRTAHPYAAGPPGPTHPQDLDATG